MFKTLAIIALLSSALFAGGEAMFGLEWNMTPQQIRDLGVSITKDTTMENLVIYYTKSLPKNMSDVTLYLLCFDDTLLVKISVIGETISDDPDGEDGKEAFGKIFAILKEKYTMDVMNCTVGKKMYDEQDEFYQCLSYGGCGSWKAFFSSPNKNIILELNGIKRSTGYISITTSADPEFSIAKKKMDTLIKNRDKSAL